MYDIKTYLKNHMVPMPSDTVIPRATQLEIVLHLHCSAPGKPVTASRVA